MPSPDAQPAATEQLPPEATYDATIFARQVPAAQLEGLKALVNMPSGRALHDKQLRKIAKNFIPDCMFHYGRDMPLWDALDMVFDGAQQPVELRDGRYLLLSGNKGPYLGGQAFLWIDLQQGIGIGAFYFHPTNGEPTPSLSVFARQVNEKFIAMSQMPPEFAGDLAQWMGESRVPVVLPRYLLTGNNKRILLEHDEDFCLASVTGNVSRADSGCEQINADAADIDVMVADYLDQVHYATNATAWMINDPEQVAWIQVRNHTCGVGLDPLGCRIRMSRERIHTITRRR